MTLLETVWSLEGDPEQVASQVAADLETGALELTGSFRNWRDNESADFWRQDENKTRETR